MRKGSEVVHYDPQRDSFYRIDKTTGQTTPSYCTGQDMKVYRPDVTGYDYHIRKVST